MEVKFAFRVGGVHISWQNPDGIGQDPGGILSANRLRPVHVSIMFRGQILMGLARILAGSDRRLEMKFAPRLGLVHVSWQDPDRIGQDPGGSNSRAVVVAVASG